MTLGRFLLSIAFLAMAVGGASAAPPAGAHLSTFEKSTGETYFALSLSPTVKPAAAKSHDLVVLFDTSASQTGVFRDDSLTALKSMLSVLGTEDRVHLVAVDLNAVPMTPGFVGANSAEMQAALNKLDARVPLGSTDMSAALQAAVESYGAKANAGRAVVYIGDGISRANFVESREFDALATKLVAARAPVSSFAIGPRRNIEGLAALANHTGGMLYLDSNQANSARQAGVVLAGVAKAPVVWPTAVRLPESLGEVYPKMVPPLRTDRDTVLFGVLSDAKAGSVAMTAEAAGHPVEMTWQVNPGKSNVEYNFLPQLVELARKGSGTGLPTLGTDGLREAARVIRANADQLAELGANSLRTGDTAGAAKVADQALRLDPLNAKAQLVQGAAQRVAEDEKDLRLTQLQVPGAPASEFAERGDDFLSSVEASRRRLEGRIEAEVNLQIRQAREMMATDPSAAVRDLKLELESVNQAVGISAGVRDELSKRLAGAIREVELRENVIRQEREEAEQNRVAAEANQRLLDQLARKQALIESLMAQFDSLMDEGEYRLADTDIAAQVRELAPAQTTPIAASWMARFSSNVRDMQVLREMRHRNFAEALKRNEEALIPFTEEYPIIYPDPEEWERITNLRKKYKSMDLMGDKPQERKIYEALDKPARLEFLDTPLADVVQFLADEHKIPIHIDTLSLQDDGIDTQTPVTVNLNGVSMRAGLRLMLEGLGLTYIIDDEVLQ
ncbi:MAG: VWA domain-containing protein, partial [Planctomycetales bacterium]|nr:VWA domain-containing protein [Planctomycetales bacterium]